MEWTPDAIARLRALREQGLSVSEMAAALGAFYGTRVTVREVQRQLRGLAAGEALRARPPAPAMPYFHKYFDEHGQPRASPPKQDLEAYLAALAAKPRKVEILHLSDLHVNQHDEELLDQVLRRHQAADLVVVAGDFLDLYQYSRFAKAEHLPFEAELEAGVRLLEFLSERFPLVVFIESNHHERVRLALQAVPSGLHFLVEPNIMRHLTQPFANCLALDRWWVQVGDAVFTHADYARGVAPRSAERVALWLEYHRRVGQLPLQPFTVVVQAHTHRVGSRILAGIKCIETGCLAKLPLGYAQEARAVAYPEPQMNGYAVVVQRGGRSLLNECREYYLGCTP